MKYVCVFKGRRDDYQLALALAEGDQLDCFVTDFYWPAHWKHLNNIIPTRVRALGMRRNKTGIPSGAVRSSSLGFLIEKMLGFGQAPSAHVQDVFDALLSRKAARIASENKSHLCCYAPYAPDAFRRSYSHPVRKVLFQYHPHWREESQILTRDQELYKTQGLIFSDKYENEKVVRRGARIETDEAWREADLILCASSFTRRTLLSEGASSKKIAVIPYGIESIDLSQNDLAAVNALPRACRVLFVGSGVQRKGLHHLLLAWESAKLESDARLIVVCRTIDPALKDLVSRTKQVELREGVDKEELSKLYRESSFFCLPSLVEGFGQVFLEALGHGLPILGTENTAVPDLGTEEDGVFCTPAGNVEELARNIERLADLTAQNRSLRAAALACAARFTWKRFRESVAARLNETPAVTESLSRQEIGQEYVAS